jgi:hypothetical protein
MNDPMVVTVRGSQRGSKRAVALTGVVLIDHRTIRHADFQRYRGRPLFPSAVF